MSRYKADQTTAVFGIFPTRLNAEQGLDSLRLSGFGNGEISVLLPEIWEVSGVFGWLSGVLPVLVPRAGKFLAAGPFVTTLKHYGVSRALSGLANAERYRVRVQQGAVLIVVHCSNCDRITLAFEVLKRCAAEDVAVPGLRQASATA